MNQNTEDRILQSREEWAAWIAEQEARTLRVYKEDPDRMIADYRRENQISRDYQGREILELLQNANDAAAEKAVGGSVRIELHPEGLVVANMGEHFTTGGVNSFRITDLSPKLNRKAKLIGQKGLGFRAVLNWSTKPFVLSGALRMTYSKLKLRRILGQLVSDVPELRRLIAIEEKDSNDTALPTLPFPELLNGSDNIFSEGSSADHFIYKRCDELSKQFDTVIGMPFDRSSFLEMAQREMLELRPEILLFTENIQQITLALPGKTEETWEVSGDRTQSILIKSNGQITSTLEYETYREKSNIPEKYLTEAKAGDYEVVIAAPIGSTSRQSETIFSFFPTNVTFPFPVVCHATFELDSSRKYPQEGQPNLFIFERIAELLACVAESRDVRANPWVKAETAARTRDFDVVLQRAGFSKSLLLALSHKKIIPTIHGEFITPTTAVRIEARNLSWLPKQGFADVCLPLSSGPLRVLIDDLGVVNLSSDELRERLNAVRFASIDERVIVIVGLIKEILTPRNPAPRLLIDGTGTVIPPEERIYFSPEKGQKVYEKPIWLKLHFLDDTLREKLAPKLGVTERRDLRQKLDAYGVQEYALSNIASAIAVDARQQMEAEPDYRDKYNQEMLIALYLLFPEDSEPPKLTETTGVPLPTITGSYSDARRLYFSEQYGDNGRFLSSLYVKRPELLVASPEYLGLDGKSTRSIAFLKWLGVASWPREMRIEQMGADFLDYVLDNVPYPMKNEKHLRTKRADFYRPFLQNVKTIDALDDILKSNPAGVITWLALDNRVMTWSVLENENGELWDHPYRSSNVFRFSMAIPSYIKWKIQHTPWLPVRNGEVVEPRRCMLGERGLEKLLPPPADFEHELFGIYRVNARLKRNAYENAGVSPDIYHLDPEEVYEIIAEMPNIDPTGKHAKYLYGNLLSGIDTDAIRWPEVPHSFLQSAMMWGRGPDGEKYYPVRQLLHADSEDFPELLCQHLTIVDLPKRVGSNKVRRLFGVEPIDRKKIKQKILRAVELPEARDIQIQFERVKPYLYYLRNVRSKQTSDIKALQTLEIILYSTIEVEIQYDDIHFSTSFDAHLQWVIEEYRAFILYADSKSPSLESDLLADTIGSVVASLLNLAQGSEFARLVRCSEHERENLLKRILGESEIPGFEEMQSQFQKAVQEFPMEIPEPQTQEKGSEPLLGSTHTGSRSLPTQPTITDSGKGEISVTQTDYLPEPAPRRREVVSRTYTGKQTGGSRTALTRVIDPDICEKRASEFERLESRIPYPVSRVTGYRGPRCDILSFASMENQEAFVNTEITGERDLSLVARFIEVKGRSHENTPISLKGNELNAARTFGEKYYLYRLYLENTAKYVLFVLQDPLNYPEAIEDVKDIYVSRAPADRYELVIKSYDLHINNES